MDNIDVVEEEFTRYYEIPWFNASAGDIKTEENIKTIDLRVEFREGTRYVDSIPREELVILDTLNPLRFMHDLIWNLASR